jgi:maltose phosphorylase
VSVAKTADRYFNVHPWKVVEQGFDPAHGRTAESVFSLGNEYMGVRGYFDEGYSGDRLAGVYLNGVFEESPNVSSPYRGIADHFCYMVNTVDWLATRIELDGERLDLGTCAFSDFTRALDLRSGILSRSFTWTTQTGKCLKLTFLRTLSMVTPSLGAQRIVFEALNFGGAVFVSAALDFSIVHESRRSSLFTAVRSGEQGGIYGILGQTKTTRHMVHASFVLQPEPAEPVQEGSGSSLFGAGFTLSLERGTPHVQDKLVRLHAEKDGTKTIGATWADATKHADVLNSASFGSIAEDNQKYWSDIWDRFDIAIEGDEDNLQGIRYCMFQLHQTYHGSDPRLNIGAKGLTGESYHGHAFWDTETYCLPFYLFTNPMAAKNLLEYRYRGLPAALARAKALDCQGACYPIATLDGTECCDMWQHASLQLQPSTGVAYGIWHYANVTGDEDFLHGHGIEMLVQICRFLSTRGQWGPRTGQFGYYCVMGPDEFQMMVHNNAYTNFMAKRTFEFAIEVLEAMRSKSPGQYQELVGRVGLQPSEPETWRAMAARMRMPVDQATGILEQHEGFFDLPHVDVGAVPIEDFPLYSHWSYDRIYRNDLIKQPDVLMFMFLHNQQFSLESKKANFEYYEPRCVHESSLSPSVHSVLAVELGKHQLAYDFFQFATRLDLDDYNRNTSEGLHTTAIAAAWVNIVYGFGGMRSDGPVLAFSPTVPDAWASYSFRVQYKGSVIKVDVDKRSATFCVIEGDPVTVVIYGEPREIGRRDLEITTPKAQVGMT